MNVYSTIPGYRRLEVSQCYPKRPGKDLSGLIIIIPIIKMPALAAATLAFLLKLSIGGENAIIPGI